MEIKKRTSGTIVILEPVGDMGLYNLGQIREILESLLGNTNPNVLVNMGQVPGIDSTTIGFFLMETNRYRDRGGALKLSKISANVQKSLRVTEIFSQLEIYEDDDKALAAFRPSRT